MPDRGIKTTVKLVDDEGLDQATINRIRRDVWDSMGEEWNRLVMRGQPKLSRGFTYGELIERRCEDALRQCGLPRSLRRLPPL